MVGINLEELLTQDDSLLLRNYKHFVGILSKLKNIVII